MLFLWRAAHPFHQPKETFTQTKQNAGYIYATKSDWLEHLPHNNFPVALFSYILTREHNSTRGLCEGGLFASLSSPDGGHSLLGTTTTSLYLPRV